MQMKFIAAGAAVLLFATSSQAATITFDDMLGPDSYTLAQSYSALGYNFTTPTNREDDFFFFGEAVREYNWSADPVGTTMSMQYPNARYDVTRGDGQSFDLVSFDFADLFNEGSFINRVSLTLNYANGDSESRDYFNDQIVGFQEVSIDARNLSSFSILSNSIQFDNFVVTVGSTAVPEPASWALMIAGFGLAGSALRKRRITPSVALA